jgi:hypothetical protein
MPRASLDDILREIEALSDEERLALDRQLANRLEQQWQRESALAREEARRRGIDQAAIDLAVERRRYGP